MDYPRSSGAIGDSPPAVGGVTQFRLWTNRNVIHSGDKAGLLGLLNQGDLKRAMENKDYIENLAIPASRLSQPVILNIVLESRNYDQELQNTLVQWFPQFPVHLLRNIYTSTTWGRGSVILPCLTDSKSLAFLVNYPQVHSASTDSDSNNTPSAQVQFLPIFSWCSSINTPEHLMVYPTGAVAAKRVAVVVLISFDNRIPEKLNEFWQLQRRQARLQNLEQWIFLDLAAAFQGWSTIWTNARQELAQRHAIMYSASGPVINLDTSRVIHQDMASIIALREDLRLFIAAYNKYGHIIRRLFPPEKPDRLDILFPPSDRQTPDGYIQSDATPQQRSVVLELLEELENRVQDTKENLEHQLETSEVIIRQLENLLSLAFNSQVIVQGQAMATLNILAALFLPLSFVASVFGMTQFELAAAWYPLIAFAVLLFVMSVLLLLRWLSVDLNIERLYPTTDSRSNGGPPTFQLIGAGDASAHLRVGLKPGQVKFRLSRGSSRRDTFDVEGATSIEPKSTENSRQAPLKMLQRLIADIWHRRKSKEPLESSSRAKSAPPQQTSSKTPGYDDQSVYNMPRSLNYSETLEERQAKSFPGLRHVVGAGIVPSYKFQPPPTLTFRGANGGKTVSQMGIPAIRPDGQPFAPEMVYAPE